MWDFWGKLFVYFYVCICTEWNLFQASIPDFLPSLMDDIIPPTQMKLRGTSLWTANEGVIEVLHRDNKDTFISVMKGSLAVTLLPSWRYAELYPVTLENGVLTTTVCFFVSFLLPRGYGLLCHHFLLLFKLLLCCCCLFVWFCCFGCGLVHCCRVKVFYVPRPGKNVLFKKLITFNRSDQVPSVTPFSRNIPKPAQQSKKKSH